MSNRVIVAGREPSQLADPLAFRTAGTAGGQDDRGALDFANIVRILREWRWLILGAVALGLALGIIATLLTTPMYRASATLEVNPPSVEILDERQRESGSSSPSSWDFVITQVGLLTSRSLAERVAQD
ncbi:MAG: hypothetical protein LH465_03930, partial [Sphingomonas bacterium]|nr:hypothetical protein [Sphingomonas bacterium]